MARIGIKVNIFQCLYDQSVTLFFGQMLAVNFQTFADNICHAHARGQRSERILEDNLHIFTKRRHIITFESGDIFTIEIDRAGTVHKAEQGETKCGFAGAAFADNTNRVTSLHRNIDAIDGLYDLRDFAEEVFLTGEVNAHIFGFDNGFGICGRGISNTARLGIEQHLAVFMLRRSEQ